MALRRAARIRGAGKPDYFLTILVALLIIFGMIMISSASVVLSRVDTGDANKWFFTQLTSVGIGFVGLLLGYLIDYRFWRKISPYLLVFNILLLIMVFMPGIGVRANGANRWVDLGFMNFQPSELMKLSLTLYLAAWFENKGHEVKKFFSSTLPFVLIIGLIVFLIMKQPDMGTTVILALIAGMIYFVAGASLLHVTGMITLAIAGGWLLIRSATYRMQRFMIFLNPSSDSGSSGYHVNQALLAIGSGGLFGLGFGHSRQKFSYLPEAATDSIFAVAAEELGLLGALFVVALFVLFAFRGYKIARTAPDVFARLVAVGITSWVVGQAFINIMAILSMMPLTGVPLPFVSYGGTSIITLMTACGILLNISKHTVKGEGHENHRFGRWHWRSYLPGFGRN
jgi:cell division protein FtsW